MDALTRDDILKKDDIVTEKLEVPEWNGFVFVRTLSGAERDEFEQLASSRKKGDYTDLSGLKAKIVALSTVDESGKRLFAGHDDHVKLNQKSAAGIDRIFKVAQRLSHLTDEDVEDLVSDFASGPSESSGSD